MAKKSPGYLHVFAQFTYHDDARIVGDKAGLEALADAVAHALKFGEQRSRAVFTNDGEGYEAEVLCVDEGAVMKLEAPYYSTFVSEEIANWRERAFKAEAELVRLHRRPRLASGTDPA